MLVKIIEAAYHGTNDETWIETDNITSVKFKGSARFVIRLVGGDAIENHLFNKTPAQFIELLTYRPPQ